MKCTQQKKVFIYRLRELDCRSRSGASKLARALQRSNRISLNNWRRPENRSRGFEAGLINAAPTILSARKPAPLPARSPKSADGPVRLPLLRLGVRPSLPAAASRRSPSRPHRPDPEVLRRWICTIRINVAQGFMTAQFVWGNRKGNETKWPPVFFNEINSLRRRFGSHQPPQAIPGTAPPAAPHRQVRGRCRWGAVRGDSSGLSARSSRRSGGIMVELSAPARHPPATVRRFKPAV